MSATGTGIGKTHVACGLVRALRAEGAGVRAYKPVLTGVAEGLEAENDAALLLAAQGLAVSAQAIAAIAPWRFARPLSPDMAAAAEGRAIDHARLVGQCRAWLAAPGPVLIEGIGGVMVPLDAAHTVLDLMQALGLPVVLVAGSYLGTLSHTLSALAVLAQRGLRAVVVVSETPDSTVGLAPTVEAIARHGGGAAVVALPWGGAQEAVFARILRVVGEAGG